jgi:hypothetical protein
VHVNTTCRSKSTVPSRPSSLFTTGTCITTCCLVFKPAQPLSPDVPSVVYAKLSRLTPLGTVLLRVSRLHGCVEPKTARFQSCNGGSPVSRSTGCMAGHAIGGSLRLHAQPCRIAAPHKVNSAAQLPSLHVLNILLFPSPSPLLASHPIVACASFIRQILHPIASYTSTRGRLLPPNSRKS